MSDLIDRKNAIDVLQILADKMTDEGRTVMAQAISVLRDLPSVEPLEDFEWCTDCKEYDQEKHCCHRWTKVIRKTVEEVKSQYALEYPKIIHCEDCKFYTPMNRALKTGICSLTMHHLGDDGFCSDAEKRGNR